MKKLKTDIDGRFPFVLDDLRWLAGGLIESLTAIAKGFGEKVILWGIENDVDGNITPGAVFIENEIYLFDGVAGTLGTVAELPPSDAMPTVAIFEIIETVNLVGLKEFPDRPDGDKLKNTYIERKVTLRFADSVLMDTYPVADFVRLSDFKQTGLSETLQLTDNQGNKNLCLDIENGLIKRKWYGVPVFGSFSQTQITLANIDDTTSVEVNYTKGDYGANNFAIEFSGAGITATPSSGGDGTTNVIFKRIALSVGGVSVFATLKSNNDILATLEIFQ